ncbi:4-hydroxybenzoate octaprenyltransferase [Oceanispirochaeta sp.]|uniref:4-hydroxybenzoate octaprenyltransferase n=1 Tax=Oceanispirochaeta sp. TaxID=2035350 RepID=UPI0026286534|nr:4-hydroxybenzoate octaprenyltransferase [Oceanispirochaeta sp.]MDA3956750.1 putative 4-hydroxybenzoate polyprenyltransferase [Oceanispirochaeta sp.]
MSNTEALRGFIRQEARRGSGISRAVMLEHTLFSLPLAICAFLLESGGRPGFSTVLWILLAVFAARNGANALNRLIDRKIDGENPRTAGRDLLSGRVKVRDLWIFTVVCGLLFLLSAAMLNPLCLLLVPVGVVLIGGYSFTKRFTWLCHFWLGVTCSAAVMGSFLALSGRFEIRYFPLTIAAALWVAGFDIIYALQDLEHDRVHSIHSVPSRFGRRGALVIAGLSHLGTLFFLAVNLFFFHLGVWYAAGVVLAALILAAEHLIAWRGGIKWIPLASYHLNQILSPLILLFTLLDIYMPGGLYGS